MLKKVLLLVPLLAPTLIYVVYAALQARRRAAAGAPGYAWVQRTPWAWLFAGGVALTALTLGAWAVLGGAPAGSVYVPPSFEDGEIVPGHHVPGVAPPDDAEP